MVGHEVPNHFGWGFEAVEGRLDSKHRRFPVQKPAEFEGLRPMPPTPSASAGCKGAGCKAAGCKAAGLQAAGLQAAGLKAARVALQAAGLQAAGLQAARVALQAAGWTWAVCAKGRKRCTVAFWDSKFATPLARQRLQRTKPRILSKKQRPKRAQVL